MTSVTIRNTRRQSISWGGRIFPPRSDTTVDVPEDKLARLRHKRGLRLVATPAPATPSYGDMNVAALKALAGERGVELPAKAKKADIVAALEAADAAPATPAPTEAEPTADGPDEEAAGDEPADDEEADPE